MSIYHLHVKTFRRSAGQSAPAAAAYRSGEKIVDKRTGEVHDYTRKKGVVSSELVLPEKAPKWAQNPSALWNRAEGAETRKNSVVAREFEVALPAELTQEQRRDLALSFARELVKKHGFAAQVSIHEPGKEGDQRNHHAHILVTTRRLSREGFTEKTRELDERLDRGPQLIEHWRERFATLQNQKLQEHQRPERVDHRTLKAQGIDREPTQHRGPAATAIERKSHQLSRITQERDQQQKSLAQVRQPQPEPTKTPELAQASKPPIEQRPGAAAMMARYQQLQQKMQAKENQPTQEPAKALETPKPALDLEQGRQLMLERAQKAQQKLEVEQAKQAMLERAEKLNREREQKEQAAKLEQEKGERERLEKEEQERKAELEKELERQAEREAERDRDGPER